MCIQYRNSLQQPPASSAALGGQRSYGTSTVLYHIAVVGQGMRWGWGDEVGGGGGAGLLHLQPGLATAHSPPSQGLQVRHPYRIIKTGRQRSSLLHGWGRNFEPFSGKDNTKKVSGRTSILGGWWFDVV